MADIKRFTGFIAPDGTTHDNLKKATEYTQRLKIKEALAEFSKVIPEVNPGVTETDSGYVGVLAGDIPVFLLAHKDDILAAFNQEVLMRAPRKVREKKEKVPKEVLDRAVKEAEAEFSEVT